MAENKKSNNPGANNYLRYLGLGFQIIATIFLGVLIGYGLDKWTKTSKPYFTIACSFLFIIAGLYFGLRNIVKGE